MMDRKQEIEINIDIKERLITTYRLWMWNQDTACSNKVLALTIKNVRSQIEELKKEYSWL